MYFSAASADTRDHWVRVLQRQAVLAVAADPAAGLPLNHGLWLLGAKGQVRLAR